MLVSAVPKNFDQKHTTVEAVLLNGKNKGDEDCGAIKNLLMGVSNFSLL